MRWLAPLLALLPIAAHAQGYWNGYAQNQAASGSCAAACTVVVPTSGAGQVVAQATGTGTGLTFAFQGTLDGGATWQTLYALPPSATPTFAASFSANGYWLVPAAGFTQIRVNLTAIGGGTETFNLSASVPANVSNP